MDAGTRLVVSLAAKIMEPSGAVTNIASFGPISVNISSAASAGLAENGRKRTPITMKTHKVVGRQSTRKVDEFPYVSGCVIVFFRGSVDRAFAYHDTGE